MATLVVTGPGDVVSALAANSDESVSVVAVSQGASQSGPWTAVVRAGEDQIPSLTALGCTVDTVTGDADELAAWQTLSGQIDDQLPIA